MNSPRDVVVILLDSLNRHLLGSYGGTEFDESDRLPFWAGGAFGGDVVYDRFEASDPSGAAHELRNRATGPEAAGMTELLVEALRSIEAPEEQLVRLGIT